MTLDNVELRFLDKRFRMTITEDNQVDRVTWFSGTEARSVFNILDIMINSRPRSDDDRLSIEAEARRNAEYNAMKEALLTIAYDSASIQTDASDVAQKALPPV